MWVLIFRGTYNRDFTICKNWSKSPEFFLDIVNCESDDGCHANASCTDDNGSYVCVCNDGFTGDGFNCTGNKSNILFIPT